MIGAYYQNFCASLTVSYTVRRQSAALQVEFAEGFSTGRASGLSFLCTEYKMLV